MKPPSQKSIEAAWRIWKKEVTTHHAPIQSVTEIAQKIEDIFFPEDHACGLFRDMSGRCFQCGNKQDKPAPLP